ncbi:magnesium-dependent phosphatase-1 [Armillaria borealis]|uniref:Magnesium-dependent phosphatase-1 n=1 Tax=Armillaria borealis TaxID=47425 RepID=A0AA39J9P7_9AGAR|nr:magnesium-dependent phosphatase-1 [Armillaria borealis]
MTTRYPKLVAFDLDYTLWDLWIDTHVSGPLHRHKNTLNEILDRRDSDFVVPRLIPDLYLRHNSPISFYRDVPHILHRLREAEVIIAAASRTSAPNLARQALSLLLVPPKDGDKDTSPFKAAHFFDQAEIYPGSKLTHFKRIHEKTGISYSEMLFFDDEHRNKEVEQLGVTFCLVPDGVNHKVFEKGLSLWQSRNAVEVVVEGDTA